MKTLLTKSVRGKVALLLVFNLLLLGTAGSASAAFSARRTVSQAPVSYIFVGQGEAVFVQFSGTSAPGCYNNVAGGYLTPSWRTAYGTFDDSKTKRLLAMLLTAKATGARVSVGYRVNDQSSSLSWSGCTIDDVSF